ncbi:hypothetical protein [Deinococcus sp. DB0503]|uniref:hypothetical protein n=1 Tax=Deinococcus sp. DB0503 TaxID=2479203 RepID=UPI0018E056AF|nr:hypothetical protein [Deinococcus sp. DB0503]MBI0445350.1 hypothetical protein [Deinococcus sp. DB0503]
MNPAPLTLAASSGKLRLHQTALAGCQAGVEQYLRLKQKRHEHLTRRYERLERRTDDIRDTARNRKLLAEYGCLGEQHARSEEEMDDLENLVLEPLREAREVLRRPVS